LELGINTFDTANAYSSGKSEVVLGKAIKQLGLPRDEIVVLTKCYFPVGKTDDNVMKGGSDFDSMGYINLNGLSRKHIFDAVDASLKRLDLDYIDVLQCHRFDYKTPLEETMQALHDVVQTGKVRYIGMSSCYAWQFQAMQQYAIHNRLTPFISMQNLYNAIYREEEREMLPTLKHFGVGCIPWSPLARGFLARPVDSEDTSRGGSDHLVKKMTSAESDAKINAAVAELAKAKGYSMAQIALAYVLSKDLISAPIVGSTKLESIKELVGALDIKLSPEEIQKIEDPYTARAIFGHA